MNVDYISLAVIFMLMYGVYEYTRYKIGKEYKKAVTRLEELENRTEKLLDTLEGEVVDLQEEQKRIERSRYSRTIYGNSTVNK